MGPCVGGELVALGMHFADYGGPGWSGVDGTFAVIDASDEKGRFGIVALENGEKFVGVDVGSVCELASICDGWSSKKDVIPS